MAEFSKAYTITAQHEGGYVYDPSDRGGMTYCGISRGAFPNWKGWATIDRLKPRKGQKFAELDSLVSEFYYDNFWGRCSEIDSQPLANFIYDFRVHSGANKATKTLQGLLALPQDGIMGSGTIKAVNKANAVDLLAQLKLARVTFLKAIVAKDATQKKFLDGWLNRVDSYTV